MKKLSFRNSFLAVLLLSAICLAPILLPSRALALVGARSFSAENGDVFLGGDYIELGVSSAGSFGTTYCQPLPDGFFVPSVEEDCTRSNIGMVTNPAGFGVEPNLTMDFFLPGSPEERWNVGYTSNGDHHTGSNSLLESPVDISDNAVTDQSSGDHLQASSVGTFNSVLKTTQVISFNKGERSFKNVVTLKNVSSDPISHVRYMRNVDPDNTRDLGGTFNTQNTIVHTIAADGVAMVQADTSNNPDDPAFAVNGSHSPLFYISTDPRARVSTFGFENTDPYEPDAYDTAPAKGYTIDDDIAISIAFDVGTLAPNQSTTLTYYTSLDPSALDSITHILSSQGTDSDGISPSIENRAPNNGDANKDGTKDSLQSNVASIVDGVSGKYVTVATPNSCSLSDVSSASEASDITLDSGFDYPAGLVNFSADCGTPGATIKVKLYFYGSLGSDFVLRKYNPTTHGYSTIVGATITKTTIGGQDVNIVSYNITDGSSQDTDGLLNGVIVDPAGIAVQSVGVPNTGVN